MAKKLVNVTTINREEWVELRKRSIGGSDAATIVGLNPYASHFTLYADKMGLTDEKEDNEAMRQGRDLEEYVAQRFEEATGKKVRRNNFMYLSDENPFMSANLDRDIVGENAGLECKTTSVYNNSDFSNEEIPLNYYCQCMHYMAVMGYDRMYLAVLVLNKGFFHFVIERNEDEIRNLIEAETAFWNNHIVPGVPPKADGNERTKEVLDKMFPAARATDDKVMLYEFDEAMIQFEFLNQQIKSLQTESDTIKNQIIQQLGDSSYGFTGKYEISYKAQSRAGVDSKLLQSKYPDIAAEVATKSEFRVFRTKLLK